MDVIGTETTFTIKPAAVADPLAPDQPVDTGKTKITGSLGTDTPVDDSGPVPTEVDSILAVHATSRIIPITRRVD